LKSTVLNQATVYGYDGQGRRVQKMQCSTAAICDAATAGKVSQIADSIIPLPRVRREIEMAKFAHRRSTRATREAAARSRWQDAFLRNGFVSGVVRRCSHFHSQWVAGHVLGVVYAEDVASAKKEREQGLRGAHNDHLPALMIGTLRRRIVYVREERPIRTRLPRSAS
jgi:hypothetical protein